VKAAAIQMTSTRDVQANLREAGRLVAEAARQGAKLAVLPENFSFLGATDADRVAAIEQSGDGPAQRFLAETAQRFDLWLVGGTIPIRDAGRDAGGRAMQGAIADDQRRVVTPTLALRSGADYIVVGRPIRDAADPFEAAAAIQAEIAGVFG
jgi:predicted amidohydrolase